MKLINIQIYPKVSYGWQSDLLVFGDNITQLYGPNGCGKTPIVQSIAFCLGFPCKFRNDIYEHCSHVILNIKTPNGNLEIKRFYIQNMEVEITDSSGDTQIYFDEKEYSRFLFEHLGMSVSNLVTTSNKITIPYLATILPLFYLDQDEGYSGFYCPPSNFIKDQFSEMIRMIFGLPVKNSFDSKKDKIIAKEKLDYLDKSVQSHARQVNAAIIDTKSIYDSSDELTEKIKSLEASLENLKGSGANHDDSIKVYDNLISFHKSSIIELTNQISEINKRNRGLGSIISEINSEIETLTLNEDARRVFLSFSEICCAEKCELFSYSSESYSKNLLYLKDQLKDLERNSDLDSVKVEGIKLQKQTLEELVKSIVEERNSVLEKSEISAFVDAISEIKNQIFELQNQRSEIDKVETLRKKHLKLLSDRNDALNEYQSFSVEKASIPELLKLRSVLRQNILVWLEKLHTINISRDITFKDDFIPLFGKESILQLKGSTKIRAVLAYHAALLEIIAKNIKPSFRFIILDTPKQHEIHNDDLDRYMNALKKLCIDFDLQIVFSTTEYHYNGDDHDAEWKPQYPGKEQNMFLTKSVP